MIRRLISATFALAFSVAACKSEEVHEVHIKFAETRIGNLQRGFWCREADSKTFLLQRLAATNRNGSMVVDFLKLGGIPSCRPAQLQDFCSSHDCSMMTERRTCIPLGPHDPTKAKPSNNPIDVVLADIAGTAVTHSAPEDYVLLRVVLTAQTCDEIGSGNFSREQLVGCAHSCPVLLKDIDGDVLLDLDIRDDNCEPQVIDCAEINAAYVSARAQ